MIATAAARGFRPARLLFDRRCASLEDLGAVRELGRTRLTQPEADPGGTGLRPVSAAGATAPGAVVHLEGYGRARAFAIAAGGGGIECWATDDLGMDGLGRLPLTERARAIEEYRRGLKRYCGVERPQARGHRARRDRIGPAIRALLRLGWHRYAAGVSRAESRARVVREAVRGHVTRPLYALPGTA